MRGKQTLMEDYDRQATTAGFWDDNERAQRGDGAADNFDFCLICRRRAHRIAQCGFKFGDITCSTFEPHHAQRAIHLMQVQHARHQRRVAGDLRHVFGHRRMYQPQRGIDLRAYQ